MVPALIELKAVNKSYREGNDRLHALSDVNLKIEAGEFVAIMGPSGSGKSTLANVIAGLDVTDSGTVVVDGVDLAKARDNQLSQYRNQHIGFVFQSFNLQPRYTVIENVMVPLMLAGVGLKQRRAVAQKCLTEVGLAGRAKSFPTELSGGERQRVSIARALAATPSIIIADEPTGNLDSARGREIIELLRQLNRRGITLLVITHDTGIAAQAKRVLNIKDGRVSEKRG